MSTKPGELPFDKWFSRTITSMMKKENFVKNLPLLVGDTKSALERSVARGGVGATSGIMDPFDDIYRIVYLLTMRTVGANEIARSPELLEKTLGLFETIEQCSSPARIIFPWMMTPAHLRKMYAGGKLYMIFSKLVEERKEKGRREDDALQFLIDSGSDMVRILSVSSRRFLLWSLVAEHIACILSSCQPDSKVTTICELRAVTCRTFFVLRALPPAQLRPRKRVTKPAWAPATAAGWR